MKKVLLGLLILIVAVAGYVWYKFSTDKGMGFKGDKAVQLTVSKHSPEFNQSLDNMLAAYFSMKDAFVDADTAVARAGGKKMLQLADSLKLDELKKDSAGLYETVLASLTDVKSNAVSLLAQTKLEEMRLDFKQVNESLFMFLKAINYEGSKLYWQNCPMAFGEDKAASWISNTEEIVNPYLGKNHPEFKGTMLHCGEIIDTIKAK